MARTAFLKIILLFVAILAGVPHAAAWAGDIVVIQSSGLSAYNNAVAGFENVLLRDIPASGPKAVLAHTITSHILSETESPSQLRNTLSKQRPSLVLVIGSSSLALVKDLTDMPILYLMVPYPEMMLGAQDNITGVNMHISAEQQMAAFTRALPQIQSVGLLYDPEQTGMIVREAQDVARQYNISLIALPVKEAREVPGRLGELTGRVDCFWMLPDRTVLTPQTMDAIFLFSLENRIPVATFSEKYLDMGAVLSVSFDTFDMGKQAGEMALKVLNNTRVSDLPPEQVRKVVVRTNAMAAKTLGIVLEGQAVRE